jgi:hypothetical protein
LRHYDTNWKGGVQFSAREILSLLYIVQTGWLFLQRYNGRRMKLSKHFHPMLRPRMMELYLHSPIRLYGVIFN